ncbi:DNA-processing protein DprA [Dendrosporobacter sp. 1207_IL3150]|uniref:DNA-processing protein DprA n=1 Tax=Dendrosporobacter sp. 1207_IL3150 TaxID=3084054 RepID=UPI002FDB2D30
MEKIFLAGLQMVPGIGNSRIKKLIDYFGSAQQAWQASKHDLLLCKNIDATICNNLILLREKIDILNLADKWFKQDIKLCHISERDYPGLLRNVYNPPDLFFYRGILPKSEKLIAIVGSRQSTAYGKNAANMLGRELAAADICVVSGAARGIDTAAHKGALTTGKTIAVLGCGVDISYPPENRYLLDQISDCGTVISEYAPGTTPHAAFFPARNRIISGLSAGVVVVEAAERSGALITTEHALDNGRDVFAIPGSIFSDASKGVHKLIKQGAKLIDSIDDILEEYNWACKQNAGELSLSKDETVIYNTLNFDNPLTVEEIVVKTNLTIPVISYILLQLELRGLVAEHCPQYYVRAIKGVLGE